MTAVSEYVTTCSLCGKAVAKAPPLELPLTGDIGKPAESLIGVLLKHLSKHHPVEIAQATALLAEFHAYAMLAAFKFEDPSIQPRMELTRLAVLDRVKQPPQG